VSGVVAHACNPSIQKAEAGWSKIWGQPRLHGKTLSQKTKNKPKNYLVSSISVEKFMLEIF
jgi:hypothetical protein